jgi:hypothetical protein
MVMVVMVMRRRLRRLLRAVVVVMMRVMVMLHPRHLHLALLATGGGRIGREQCRDRIRNRIEQGGV